MASFRLALSRVILLYINNIIVNSAVTKLHLVEKGNTQFGCSPGVGGWSLLVVNNANQVVPKARELGT